MTRDEMIEAMARDVDNPDAYVHNPMLMSWEDARTWVDITYEAMASLLWHLHEHIENDDSMDAINNEYDKFMLMAHNVGNVTLNKLLTERERLEAFRKKMELRFGEPIKNVNIIQTPLGYGVTFEKDEDPLGLNGLEAANEQPKEG